MGGGGKIPGISAEGLFFFSFGAFLSIRNIDFAIVFKRYWFVATCVAVPLVITMVLSHGNNDDVWGYAHRLFTLFGSICTIGIIALLFQKQRIKVNRFLSKSSFFVYAAHGAMILTLIQSYLGKALPYNQIGLLVGYFMSPLITVVLLVFCYFILSKIMPKTLSVLTGGRVE